MPSAHNTFKQKDGAEYEEEEEVVVGGAVLESLHTCTSFSSAPLSRIITQPLPVRTGSMKDRTKKVREREKGVQFWILGPLSDEESITSYELENTSAVRFEDVCITVTHPHN